MSYVKIWLHCVWGTKKRTPCLSREVLSELTEHIKDNAKVKGIYIDAINGYREHIHCIISLNPDQALAKVIQLIKGESSFWVNRKRLTQRRFSWAVEYYGGSFGEKDLDKVRLYIKNQEIHHKVKTWDEECDSMIEEYGFERYKS
ncbi:MAG: transposase [Bacteroidetes bacterium GWC2_40_22]|nr:MAG: transposase [Bacteroidetes bacterium GWC2_40_22]